MFSIVAVLVPKQSPEVSFLLLNVNPEDKIQHRGGEKNQDVFHQNQHGRQAT